MTELRDAVAAAKEFLEWMPSYDDEIIQVIRVEDVEDAVAAAISAWNRRADDWHPIETAPRDGTSIVVDNGRGQFTCAWDDDWWQVWDGKNDHPLRGSEPTYWRPLPKGPGG